MNIVTYISTKISGLWTYAEYLKSDQWDVVCSEYKKNYCQKCDVDNLVICYECEFKTFIPLNLHHLNYDNLGNESKDDVITLCDECHSQIHGHTFKRVYKHKFSCSQYGG